MVAALDLSGMKFGRLTPIKRVGTRWGQALWLCDCDCGNKKTTVTSELTGGGILSCGCLRKEVAAALKKKDLTGKVFAMLTVIRENGRTKEGVILWECGCKCGKKVDVASRDLISGHSKSCGCLQRMHAKKHIKKLNDRQRGKDHPCWRGGINRPYPLIWTPYFRTKFRKKHGYKCTLCGKPGIGLDIHHIDENKENCLESNLIVLCRKCHRRVHAGKIDLKATLRFAVECGAFAGQTVLVDGGYVAW